MRESKVEYSDDDYDVVITVRQASMKSSIKRQVLRGKQAALLEQREKEGEPAPFHYRYYALQTLPQLFGSTVEIVNAKGAKLKLPDEMGIDEFMELPEALVALWEEAALGVNPHWLPKDDESGEESEPGKGSG